MVVMELEEMKWKELTVEPRRSSAVPVGGAGEQADTELSASRWAGAMSDRGGWMSCEGVRECVSRYTEGCLERGGDEARNGLSALVSIGVPWATGGLVYACEDSVQLESVRKETGFRKWKQQEDTELDH